MRTLHFVSGVFIGISVLFVVISIRDYLKAEGKMTIARKVWLRMALIFAIVGIGLCFLQILINDLTVKVESIKQPLGIAMRRNTIRT